MSKARLVITAVVEQHRPVAEVAASYGVHRAWVYKLLARYRAEGEAAFEPRSRRPKTSPHASPDQRPSQLVLSERGPAGGLGLRRRAPTRSAGTWTSATASTVSRATIHADPDPARPRSTPAPKKTPEDRRTSASRPTSPTRPGSPTSPTVRLADGTDVEVITWLDDHSRYALHITAHRRDHRPDRARHVPRHRGRTRHAPPPR